MIALRAFRRNDIVERMSLLYLIAMVAATMCPSLAASQDNTCVRDYSPSCAEGWTESPLYSRVCEAPISYFGPCATLLPSLESRDDKERMEKECRINWPCYNQCEQAYDAKCPKFWQHENGLCMPTPAYHGPCAYPIDLSKLQTTERVLWSNRCGVTWPCKRKCNANYNEPCPEGWKHAGKGQCVAPESYNGPCFPTADLSFFSAAMKEQFETLCDVAFPCAAK